MSLEKKSLKDPKGWTAKQPNFLVSIIQDL